MVLSPLKKLPLAIAMEQNNKIGCCLCDTIKSKKYLPTRVPVECPSTLAHQCLRRIADSAALLEDPGLLRNLPTPLLEELKFLLTDDALYSLSDMFKEMGVDTSPAWEIHLYRRFEYRAHESCKFSWMEPWIGQSAFLIAPDCQDPCQVYMSKLCEQLIKDAMKDHRESDGNMKICQPCMKRFSSYLSSVSFLTVAWKDLSWIVELDTDFAKVLKSTLKHIVDLNVAPAMFNIECGAVSGFLRKLLAGEKLRSLMLGPLLPENGKCHRLLEALFATEKSNEAGCGKKGEVGATGSGNNKAIDDEETPLNPQKSAEANMKDIRKQIKLLKECVGRPQENQGGLESLTVQTYKLPFHVGKPMEDLRHFVKLLPSIKRLELEVVDTQGWNDVLAMVGNRQLTHLRMKSPAKVIYLLLSVLFENYRRDDASTQPMEFLGLSEIEFFPLPTILLDYSHPITAVRQLELVDCDLTCSMAYNLRVFLSCNKSLTHLELNSVTFDTSRVPVASLISAVAKHRTLETFILVNDEQNLADLDSPNLHTAKEEKAVVQLLKTNKQLKHLVLRNCKVTKQFVSSDAFLKAVTTHRGLEHLSLSNNKLGKGAVDLLLALSEPKQTSSLKRLYLEHCLIPGQELLEASRSISQHRRGRLFLQHMSLCHNNVSEEELLELRRRFSTCVQLPLIEGRSMWSDEEDLDLDD